MDWFKSAIEMDASSCIKDAASMEIPVQDWFYEVTEDQDEFKGLCQDKMPIAHAVESEGKYQGDGTTCELSGWTANLDVQTAETIACPLGNHKGGEDDPTMKMPEIERDVYKEYLSIPHFEGKEENMSEMRDLPVVPIPGITAPDPSPAIRFSKIFEPECVSEGHKKFLEVPGVVQDAVFVIHHFKPNFTVGGCLFGQEIIPSVNGIEGLTLDVTIDLKRPLLMSSSLRGSTQVG